LRAPAWHAWIKRTTLKPASSGDRRSDALCTGLGSVRRIFITVIVLDKSSLLLQKDMRKKAPSV
jgi:hypothetical protein